MQLTVRILSIGVPLAIVLLAIGQPYVDPKLLFLDPVVAAEVDGENYKTYFGAFSTLGVMLWAAGASACLLGAAVLARIGAPRQVVAFALAGAALTGWLALDDAFLIHENLAPKIGIPQTVVLALYALLAIAYGICSIREIAKGDLMLFGAAALFLGLSLGIDVVLHSSDSIVVALEDGSKLIGIAAWSAFHIKAMGGAIQRQVNADRSVHLLRGMARRLSAAAEDSAPADIEAEPPSADAPDRSDPRAA